MLRNECKWIQFCPMKRFYEAGKLDERFISGYCLGTGRAVSATGRRRRESCIPTTFGRMG